MNHSSSPASPAANLIPDSVPRRIFLQQAGGGLAAGLLLGQSKLFSAPVQATANAVELPPLSAATEAKEKSPTPSMLPAERVGFAIVGLGHLAIDRVLPAFGKCKYARPVALVSGDATKARKIAHQYGIPETALCGYDNFESLARNPEVKVVYIILPNGMHAEYTVRAAKAGKHVLCEKPMANSAAECEQMIAACKTANVKLMIAYRSQYEPLDRAIVKMVQQKKLGALREFVAVNSQNQGDPKQWRLNRKLAGGGSLPDVGIYAINAARFMSGEEPVEVSGQIFQPTHDPRFQEVEASAQFLLKFPSGFAASGSCSYDTHRSQFLRIHGSEGWAELNPAFAYDNLKLRHGLVDEERDAVVEIAQKPADQFAAEMDHFAECVLSGGSPHTPGEEGLQDLRIIEAIYESARTGRSVKLSPITIPKSALPEAG